MSDETAAGAAQAVAPADDATEAQTTEQTTPEPEAPEQQTAPEAEGATDDASGLPPRQAARKRMHERLESRRAAREAAPGDADAQGPEDTTEAAGESPEAAADDPAGRKRDPETGRFVAETEGDTEETEATAAPGPQDAEQDGPTEEAAAEPPPEGMVRIELPDDHPLRDQGLEHLDAPAEQERTYRTLVNSAARRSEVEAVQNRIQTAEDRAQKAEEELARLRVRAEAGVPQDAKALLNDPQIKQWYEDNKQAYGEEAAEAALLGEHMRRQQPLREQEEQAVEQARLDHQADTFLQQLDSVKDKLPERYEVWASQGELRGRFERALREFAEGVDAGTHKPGVQSFIRTLDMQYAQDDRVIQTFQQKQEEQREAEMKERLQAMREELKQEIRAELEEEAQEAAQRHSTKHPLGRASSAVQTGRQTGRGEAALDLSEVPAPQRKKAIRRHLTGR